MYDKANLLRILFLLLILLASVWFFKKDSSPSLPKVRAIWVTRLNYRSPEDVKKIIKNIADAGFTDLFFQVRGNGTVFYESALEPWAYELSGWNADFIGRNPDWDPLQLASELARQYGIRIHAYINVLPGWSGNLQLPASSEQLWMRHRDWFMVDKLGDTMKPVSGWYTFLNPALPEVRQHICGIVRELCEYDIDGIHLDYIRYPYDYKDVAHKIYPDVTKDRLIERSTFSYDTYSLNEQKRLYGENPSVQQIANFRRDSITKLVRDIFYTLENEEYEDLILSASVLGNPNEARIYAYQDYVSWLHEGMVDWVVQMNYRSSHFEEYYDFLKDLAGNKHRDHLLVGLLGENDAEQLIEQAEMALGSRGVAIFAYSHLFDEDHRINKKGQILLKEICP